MTVNDPPTQATRTNLQNQQSALAAYLSSLKEGNAPAQRMVTVANEHSHNERTQHDVDDDALLSSARTLSQATSRNRCQAMNVISRGTVYGYREDVHIGEATRPGPASYSADMNMHVRKHSVLEALFIAVACVLSIYDGMGCGLISLRNNHAQSMDRYIAVEIPEDARRVAKNANPFVEGALNIDHSWHTNVLNITEEEIKPLGHNAVRLFLAGPPWQTTIDSQEECTQEEGTTTSRTRWSNWQAVSKSNTAVEHSEESRLRIPFRMRRLQRHAR
jgi:hypothetical protein